MDNNSSETEHELQPIAECFIKKEIDYESSSTESQDEEEVNPLYPNIVIETDVHGKVTEENVEEPTSPIQPQVFAEPHSIVWSLNDDPSLETETDDQLIVPDFIIRKRKSTSKEEEEEEVEETSRGTEVDPLSIEISTPGVEDVYTPSKNGDNITHLDSHNGNSSSNLNSIIEAKRRKTPTKRKNIDRKYMNKLSSVKRKPADNSKINPNYDLSNDTDLGSDFDPSLVVVPYLEVIPSSNVINSSTDVSSTSEVGPDGPITIHIDPHDYKPIGDPSTILTVPGNAKLIENPRPSISDPSSSESGAKYNPKSVIVANPKVNLLKCTLCKFSCFNPTNFATHVSTHEQPLQCSYCDFTCVKPHHLKKHTETHFGKRYFECDECEFKCSNTKGLVWHMKKHGKKEQYNCKHCEASFSSVEKFADHLSSHRGIVPFSCSVCNLVFNNQMLLKNHQKSVHSKGLSAGKQLFSCDEDFSDDKLLKDHESANSNEKDYGSSFTKEQSFSCSFCSENFADQKLLIVHTRIKHSKDGTYPAGVKTLTCGVCYSVFPNQRRLKDHERVEGHAKINAFQVKFDCSVCGESFSTQKLLRCHQRAEHKNEKLFQCVFCNYKCFESGRLKLHLRTHTGEKPYECEFCKYRCADLGYLKLHLRVHTGEKPYQCKECDARFTRSNNLKSHMRTHTLDKPHKCGEDDKSEESRKE